MGKKVCSKGSKIDPNRTLEKAVKQSVQQVWAEISADVDWPIDLEGAVELCLDAVRPVIFGYMTENEYSQLLKYNEQDIDLWAKQALQYYF